MGSSETMDSRPVAAQAVLLLDLLLHHGQHAFPTWRAPAVAHSLWAVTNYLVGNREDRQ